MFLGEKTPLWGKTSRVIAEFSSLELGVIVAVNHVKTSVSVSVCQCVSSVDSVELLDALLGLF